MSISRGALILLIVLPLVNAQSVSEALVLRWYDSVGVGSTVYIEDVPYSLDTPGNLIFLDAEDINKDGLGEIVVVTGSGMTSGDWKNTNLVIAYGNDGTLLWKVGIKDLIQTAIMKDIDRDGYVEILIGSGRLVQEIGIGKVTVIDHNGKVLRTLSLSTTIMKSLTIADLDNDRYDEIIGGSSMKIHVFDSFGTPKWNYLIGTSVNVIVVDDIYGDENKEIIAGADDLYIINKTNNVEIWYDIEALSGYKGDRVDKILLEDISPVGKKEILLTTEKSGVLYAFISSYNITSKRYFLSRAWYYPAGEKITTLITANIDSDEYGEILLGSSDNLLHVIDNDGTLLWTYMMNGDITGIKVADLDNDTFYEVIASTTGGSIFVLDRDDGSFRWRYDIEGEEIITLDVKDLDDDHLMEIIAGTLEKNIYVFELNVTFTDLQLADTFYFKAQERYLISDYNFSLGYLMRAKEIYLKYDDTDGLNRVSSLQDIINDKLLGTRRKQADAYYEKAQEAFIIGDYEKSREFANLAKEIYAEFGETQSVLRCQLLLRRIDVFMEGGETTTSTIEEKGGSISKNTGRSLLTIVILLIITLVVIFLIRRKRRSEAMEKDMESYEKDMEKAIDEDIDSMER